jgi:hypothetical protein
MNVHNLTIDSSQRDTTLYPHANSYVITLKNPIYDVSEINLLSGRIPTPQTLICETNNTFTFNNGGQDSDITLPDGNYTLTQLKNQIDSNLSSLLNTLSVTLNATNKTFTIADSFSPPATKILKFKSGTNGYNSNTSPLTTPHQILGFSSDDYEFTDSITTGYVNLTGPNSLVLKMTVGSDILTQTVFSSTPFYTGHILLDGSEFVNFNGSDDKLIHHFHSGPQKHIRDIKIEFFYMNSGRLIPYDFRNQDHILKIEMKCSTDKLEGLPKVPIKKEEEEEEEEFINIPEVKNVYRFKKEYIYIALIVVVGLLLLFFMKGKPTRYPRTLSE